MPATNDAPLPTVEMLHFLLREVEKLRLLVERLQARNIVHPIDLQIVELQAEIREVERLEATAQRVGDTRSLIKRRERVAELRLSLASLENPLTLPPSALS